MAIPRYAVVAWYTPDQYAKLLAVWEGAGNLLSRWEDWHGRAQALLDRIRAEGGVPERVEIDVDQFVVWCRHRKCRVDGQAAQQFAAQVFANRKSGN